MASVAIELDGVLGDTRPLYDAWLEDVSRRAHVDPAAARRGAAELARAARAVRRGSRSRLPAAERSCDRGASPPAGARASGSACSPTRRRSWRGSRVATSARPAGSRCSRRGRARSTGCSLLGPDTRGCPLSGRLADLNGGPRAHRPPARGAAGAPRPHRRGARADQPPPGVPRRADRRRARAPEPERVAAGDRLRRARPAGPQVRRRRT